jgi:ribonuclease P protein component
MRRSQRLQRPEQFQRVRRDGKSWSHPLCILNSARNRVGRTRCGFVVGKQFGKAHDRNRAKRRMREAVRQVYPQIAPGYDLVFVVRPRAVQTPYAELCAGVRELLKRAGLWIEPEPSEQHEGASDGSVDGTGPDSVLSTFHLTTHSS